jgi:hypothetical protein
VRLTARLRLRTHDERRARHERRALHPRGGVWGEHVHGRRFAGHQVRRRARCGFAHDHERRARLGRPPEDERNAAGDLERRRGRVACRLRAAPYEMRSARLSAGARRRGRFVGDVCGDGWRVATGRFDFVRRRPDWHAAASLVSGSGVCHTGSDGVSHPPHIHIHPHPHGVCHTGSHGVSHPPHIHVHPHPHGVCHTGSDGFHILLTSTSTFISTGEPGSD